MYDFNVIVCFGGMGWGGGYRDIQLWCNTYASLYLNGLQIQNNKFQKNLQLNCKVLLFFYTATDTVNHSAPYYLRITIMKYKLMFTWIKKNVFHLGSSGKPETQITEQTQPHTRAELNN